MLQSLNLCSSDFFEMCCLASYYFIRKCPEFSYSYQYDTEKWDQIQPRIGYKTAKKLFVDLFSIANLLKIQRIFNAC